jgi:hypothetical protein
MPSGFKRDINSLTGMNDPSSGDPVEHVQELQENIRRLEARLAILEQKPDASAPVSVKSRGPAFEGENGIYVQASDSRVLIGKFDEPTIYTTSSSAFLPRSKEIDLTAPSAASGLDISVSPGILYEGKDIASQLSGYGVHIPLLVDPTAGTTIELSEQRILTIPVGDAEGEDYYLYLLAKTMNDSAPHDSPSHVLSGGVYVILSQLSPDNQSRQTRLPLGFPGILWKPLAKITANDVRVTSIQYAKYTG